MTVTATRQLRGGDGRRRAGNHPSVQTSQQYRQGAGLHSLKTRSINNAWIYAQHQPGKQPRLRIAMRPRVTVRQGQKPPTNYLVLTAADRGAPSAQRREGTKRA